MRLQKLDLYTMVGTPFPLSTVASSLSFAQTGEAGCTRFFLSRAKCPGLLSVSLNTGATQSKPTRSSPIVSASPDHGAECLLSKQFEALKRVEFKGIRTHVSPEIKATDEVVALKTVRVETAFKTPLSLQSRSTKS